MALIIKDEDYNETRIGYFILKDNDIYDIITNKKVSLDTLTEIIKQHKNKIKKHTEDNGIVFNILRNNSLEINIQDGYVKLYYNCYFIDIPSNKTLGDYVINIDDFYKALQIHVNKSYNVSHNTPINNTFTLYTVKWWEKYIKITFIINQQSYDIGADKDELYNAVYKHYTYKKEIIKVINKMFASRDLSTYLLKFVFY